MSFQADGNTRVVVKNTFIEVIEDDDDVDIPTRGCYSDSDLESLGTASTATIDDDDAPPPTSQAKGEVLVRSGQASRRAPRPLRKLPLSQLNSFGKNSGNNSPSTDSHPGGGSAPSESSASNGGWSDLSEASGERASGRARGSKAPARPLPVSQLNRLSSKGKGGTGADGSRLSSKGGAGGDGSRLSSKGSTVADSNPCNSATPSAYSNGESWSDLSESSEMLDDLQERKAEWSAGSELHGSGNCRPCLYFASKMGCVSGPRCGFCHQPHERKRRARPSKSTRMHCKQLASMIESSKGSVEVMQAARAVAEDSSYLKSILAARINSPRPIAADAPPPQEGRPAERTPAHAEVQAALRQFKQKVQMKKNMQRNIQPGLGIQPVLGRQHSRLSSASSASGSSASGGGRF